MPMYQILYRFLQALQRGRETDVQERATELGEYCPYREDLIEQVQLVFEKAHLNMAWYNRLQENRDDRTATRCHGIYYGGLRE